MDTQPSNSTETPQSKSTYGNALALVATLNGYILGPLLLFGGIGYFLYTKYDSLFFMFGGIVLAFVTTITLILKRTQSLVRIASK